MLNTTRLTIGADPELFVLNTKTKAYVSAHDLFPGTKYDPFDTAKGAIQVDGVSAEFNITPAEEAADFIENILHTTSLMRMIIKDKPELTLVAEPVADFDKDYFESLPAEAKALGCSPDYNAWTGDVNPTPRTEHPFRTGSGHIHVGWTEDADPNEKSHFFDCCEITKQLDAMLYIPSHIWDQDTRRRSLYGAAGAFRPKGYGAEYRVLSNKWVTDPDIQEWIFQTTSLAHTLLIDQVRLWQDKPFKELMKKKEIGLKDAQSYLVHLNEYGVPEFPSSYAVM